MEINQINFNKYSKTFNIFSISLVIFSIILLLFKGLNYGVDFKGGTLIELRATDKQITISQLRQSFLNMDLGDINVKEIRKNKIESYTGLCNYWCSIFIFRIIY